MRDDTNILINDDMLLIFVGHSDDAAEEAQAICELEREIQDEINGFLEAIGNTARFTGVKIWEWNYDAKAKGGGQDGVIAPALRRANIAVFIFKERIGRVTWEELTECRGRTTNRIPIIATFSGRPPSSMMDSRVVDEWSSLLKKKEELTADWTAPDSKSIRPIEDYEDADHLRRIVLKHVKALLGGLLRSRSTAAAPPPELRESAQASPKSFIDQLTDVTSFDVDTVDGYRKRLRDEVRVQYPTNLSAREFLTGAGYVRAGKLTQAGVLLFTLAPEVELPSAKTRCDIYHGTGKEAPRNRKDVTGAVYDQITQAYDFVAANIEKLELPTRGSVATSTVYRYPMNCVREVIANALCHRNYADESRMTYVRIFPDRIEVTSPGTWGANPIPEPREGVPLNELGGESVPPNFRLAHAIASINIVEMEGSGIPTSVADCATVRAPMPTVSERDGYVTVTIFPREDWQRELRRLRQDAGGSRPRDRPTVFISYNHKDEAWKNRLLPHLKVLEYAGNIDTWDDRRIDAGGVWFPEIEQAMNRAAVAVCLISANYLASDFIVKEEIPYLLERRKRDGLVIIPVLLSPAAWRTVPWLRETQMLPRDGMSLAQMSDAERESALAQISELILEIVSNPGQQTGAPPSSFAPPERVDVTRLPTTGTELFGRQKEIQMLDNAWESGGVNIVGLVGWGGVGKSTIVNKWLEQMERDNYRGALRVYAWSFHSQGAGERLAAADLFINNALEWFGDPDSTAGSPWDKGERLARLIQRGKTLLMLDGLEPLQSPHAHERGKIKDPALSTLLTELARDNPGICLITTREPVTDLDVFPETVLHTDLEQISDEAGRALLRVGGVRGTDAELEQATREFGNHALAIQLLAVYLRDIPSHHVSHAAEIPGLDIPVEAGKHPRRMFAAFEQRFGNGPEVDLLHMLGLFDRPADAASLAALRAAPPIPGLTEHVEKLAEADWLRTVEKLRRAKLIMPVSQYRPDNIDAHPLVREHFGQRLKEHLPDAWREGNTRLYQHLRDTTKEFPDTIEEMMPLYTAVIHGCAIGRHQEALNGVFWPRIRRGNKAFNLHKLGAFGANLAALRGFFDLPWQQPVPTLDEADKAFVLNEAGFCLRALGRSAEAAQSMRAGLEADVSHKAWGDAAIAAGNLSELCLTTGNLSQALTYAQRSIELAEMSGDYAQQSLVQTTLAEVLRQVGRLSEAEDVMGKAEKLHKQRQPQLPILYSLAGFRHCALLLDQGKYSEVQMRATQTLRWSKEYGLSLLTVALDYISLGRAHLFQARHEAAGDFLQATHYLNQAVDGLRQAGRLDYLPLGILARAELHRVKGEFNRARIDLDEALSIATRGSMGLHQADCHLEYARLCLAEGEKEKAREHLSTAKEMVERMGYHLRDGDVEEIGRELGEG